MELQRGQVKVGLIEHAKDLGQLRLALGQLHGDAAAAVARDRTEAGEQLDERVAGARIRRRDFDARAADLLLELRGRALGDDLSAIDDSHAVGQRVGLLEILGGQEHGHALIVSEPRDLRPQSTATLQIEARRRLVEEQDSRAVHEGEREIEPPLHAARIAAHPAVRRLGQPDAFQQFPGAPRAIGPGDALEGRLQPAGARGR